MHAFRHLNCLEKFKGELVVNEDAAVSTPDENLVDGDNRAIHLSVLNIQRFYRVR